MKHTTTNLETPKDYIAYNQSFPKIPILYDKIDKRWLYLSPPSWDCDWYWGWGYLGNRNCHLHWDSMKKELGKNQYSLIEINNEEYMGNEKLLNAKWEIEELISTFYSLKKAAEIFHRGGSNYTKSPIEDVLKNKELADKINQTIMPLLFNVFYNICNEAMEGNKCKTQE